MEKLIKVVGVIIESQNSETLSTRMTQPNLWEFPGDKVEKDEEFGDTITREIKEELGCDVEFKEVFHDNTHEYDDFIINLITAKCAIVKGEPIARKHAKLL